MALRIARTKPGNKAPRRSTLSKTKTKRPSRKKSSVRSLSAARIPAAIETMSAPSGTARFAAGKALCVTAERDPSRVYPYFDAVAALLTSDCKIVCWNAMRILGTLASVDAERKLDAQLDALSAGIRGGSLITAANAIQSLGRVAVARADLLECILPALMKVEHLDYETPECRNVALGKVLDALSGLGANVLRRPEVASFVRRQVRNPRPAVAKKAGRLAAESANARA